MLLRVLALINGYFKIFNLRLVKLANFNSLQEFKNNSSVEVRQDLLKLLCSNALLDYKELAKESKSQIGQDIFAISLLKAKKHGYFVEFGATNGVKLSNTYMLEQKHDWHSGQYLLAHSAIYLYQLMDLLNCNLRHPVPHEYLDTVHRL